MKGKAKQAGPTLVGLWSHRADGPGERAPPSSGIKTLSPTHFGDHSGLSPPGETACWVYSQAFPDTSLGPTSSVEVNKQLIPSPEFCVTFRLKKIETGKANSYFTENQRSAQLVFPSPMPGSPRRPRAMSGGDSASDGCPGGPSLPCRPGAPRLAGLQQMPDKQASRREALAQVEFSSASQIVFILSSTPDDSSKHPGLGLGQGALRAPRRRTRHVLYAKERRSPFTGEIGSGNEGMTRQVTTVVREAPESHWASRSALWALKSSEILLSLLGLEQTFKTHRGPDGKRLLSKSKV